MSVEQDLAAGAQGDVPLERQVDKQPTNTDVFEVHLDVFAGPFDLLLQLIAKHTLDVTEVALSQVTDEFIARTRAIGPDWDLGQTTEFLVVAATLLDLKAARLLPSASVEDEEDLALLEARDLLFARLLQYRAFKEAAALLKTRFGTERRYPRAVALEARYAGLLPEVLLGLGPGEFAALAGRALAPRSVPMVAVDHVHATTVSVREQALHVAERLRAVGQASFRSLTADCTTTLEVVARFLALLELYREGHVAFEQLAALGELHVRWTGGDTSPDELMSGADPDAEYDAPEERADDGADG
ncbi:MAG: segregation and condensation protein [Frankiales bacterium]|nr:segregation and condensation protein [Frankiales bacterium]